MTVMVWHGAMMQRKLGPRGRDTTGVARPKKVEALVCTKGRRAGGESSQAKSTRGARLRVKLGPTGAS